MTAQWQDGPEVLLQRLEELKERARQMQVDLVKSLAKDVQTIARLGEHHAKAKKRAGG